MPRALLDDFWNDPGQNPPPESRWPIYLLVGAVVLITIIGIGFAHAGKGDRITTKAGTPLDLGCPVATIDPDGTVVVDWACVDREASTWPSVQDAGAFAVILKAVRDGKAKAK